MINYFSKVEQKKEEGLEIIIFLIKRLKECMNCIIFSLLFNFILARGPGVREEYTCPGHFALVLLFTPDYIAHLNLNPDFFIDACCLLYCNIIDCY